MLIFIYEDNKFKNWVDIFVYCLNGLFINILGFFDVLKVSWMMKVFNIKMFFIIKVKIL